MVKELSRYFAKLSKTAHNKHASNMIAMPLSRKTEDTGLDGDFVAMSIFSFDFERDSIVAVRTKRAIKVSYHRQRRLLNFMPSITDWNIHILWNFFNQTFRKQSSDRHPQMSQEYKVDPSKIQWNESQES
jgi:hypothetical protein